MASTRIVFVSDLGRKAGAVLEYSDESFRVLDGPGGAVLVDALRSDRVSDVSVYSGGRLSFAAIVGSTQKTLGITFETTYEAERFLSWLKDAPLLRFTNDSSTSKARARLLPEHVTTLFELPGYRIVRSLGVVTGINVRSASAFGGIFSEPEIYCWGFAP